MPVYQWVKCPNKRFWGYRVGTVSAFVWQESRNPDYFHAVGIGLGSGGDTDLERLKAWAAKQVDESQDPVGARDVDRRITLKQFELCVKSGNCNGMAMNALSDEQT